MKGLKVNLKLASLVPCEGSQNKNNQVIFNNRLECSKITENLFLSGYKIAQDYDYLKSNNFTHILNCAIGSRTFKSENFEGFEYLQLDLKDDPGFDIIIAIYSAIDFLENAQKSNGKILIHCVEGISRGPALLASYFMWKYNVDKDKAILKIKNIRKCVEINLGFMVQLDKWEARLNYSKEDETNEGKNLNQSSDSTEI